MQEEPGRGHSERACGQHLHDEQHDLLPVARRYMADINRAERPVRNPVPSEHHSVEKKLQREHQKNVVLTLEETLYQCGHVEHLLANSI